MSGHVPLPPPYFLFDGTQLVPGHFYRTTDGRLMRCMRDAWLAMITVDHGDYVRDENGSIALMSVYERHNNFYPVPPPPSPVFHDQRIFFETTQRLPRGFVLAASSGPSHPPPPTSQTTQQQHPLVPSVVQPPPAPQQPVYQAAPPLTAYPVASTSYGPPARAPGRGAAPRNSFSWASDSHNPYPTAQQREQRHPEKQFLKRWKADDPAQEVARESLRRQGEEEERLEEIGLRKKREYADQLEAAYEKKRREEHEAGFTDEAGGEPPGGKGKRARRKRAGTLASPPRAFRPSQPLSDPPILQPVDGPSSPRRPTTAPGGSRPPSPSSASSFQPDFRPNLFDLTTGSLQQHAFSQQQPAAPPVQNETIIIDDTPPLSPTPTSTPAAPFAASSSSAPLQRSRLRRSPITFAQSWGAQLQAAERVLARPQPGEPSSSTASSEPEREGSMGPPKTRLKKSSGLRRTCQQEVLMGPQAPPAQQQGSSMDLDSQPSTSSGSTDCPALALFTSPEELALASADYSTFFGLSNALAPAGGGSDALDLSSFGIDLEASSSFLRSPTSTSAALPPEQLLTSPVSPTTQTSFDSSSFSDPSSSRRGSLADDGSLHLVPVPPTSSLPLNAAAAPPYVPLAEVERLVFQQQQQQQLLSQSGPSSGRQPREVFQSYDSHYLDGVREQKRRFIEATFRQNFPHLRYFPQRVELDYTDIDPSDPIARNAFLHEQEERAAARDRRIQATLARPLASTAAPPPPPPQPVLQLPPAQQQQQVQPRRRPSLQVDVEQAQSQAVEYFDALERNLSDEEHRQAAIAQHQQQQEEQPSAPLPSPQQRQQQQALYAQQQREYAQQQQQAILAQREEQAAFALQQELERSQAGVSLHDVDPSSIFHSSNPAVLFNDSQPAPCEASAQEEFSGPDRRPSTSRGAEPGGIFGSPVRAEGGWRERNAEAGPSSGRAGGGEGGWEGGFSYQVPPLTSTALFDLTFPPPLDSHALPAPSMDPFPTGFVDDRRPSLADQAARLAIVDPEQAGEEQYEGKGKERETESRLDTSSSLDERRG
ncbi:hypothetical protein JCM8547_004529 [Rhodosporidiobolus lusitaniae]